MDLSQEGQALRPPNNSWLCPRLLVKLQLEFLPKQAEKVRKKLELTPKIGQKKVRIFLFWVEFDSGSTRVFQKGHFVKNKKADPPT